MGTVVEGVVDDSRDTIEVGLVNHKSFLLGRTATAIDILLKNSCIKVLNEQLRRINPFQDCDGF